MAGSDGSPSNSSMVEVELSSLLADIQSRYVVQEPDPPSPSLPKYPSSLAGSVSLPIDGGETFVDVSLSNSESLDDLVPLASLKKGARKRLLRSTGFPVSGSKIPCVSGPVSHTRARQSNLEGISPNPQLSPVPRTRSRVKPFSERKLLKGKWCFPLPLILA
ncbi:hypothetical protein HAX54_005204 [Datura stramonium]|uniref:Uncharacterized protein n=1 Tax=Datura stramonium TaxID=4076 RepID=A0ABS8T8C1_DATST|nr:hypothetical protein [Datura stramonium]